MLKPILMQFGTSDPWGRGMKRSTSGSVGQVKFGGLSEVFFSTSWVQ